MSKADTEKGLQTLLSAISQNVAPASQEVLKKISEEIEQQRTEKLKEKLLRIQGAIDLRLKDLRHTRAREKMLLASLEQAKQLATSLVKGGEDAWDNFDVELGKILKLY